MDLKLNGKTAIITGSSKGIGNAIAKSLHSEGCNVILNGRNIIQLEEAYKEFPDNASFHPADVTQFDDCIQLVNEAKKKFGKIDILICNVGNGQSAPPGFENIDDYKKMLDINFFTAINMIYASIDELSRTKGAIVCISSIAGIEVTGAPITYSVSKAALNSFIHGIARPLAKKNIRINAIAPGNIFFEGSVWEKKLKQDNTKTQKMLEDNVALQKFGIPEDIAYLTTFLVSPLSSFLTGSVIVLDGGQVRSYF